MEPVKCHNRSTGRDGYFLRVRDLTVQHYNRADNVKNAEGRKGDGIAEFMEDGGWDGWAHRGWFEERGWDFTPLDEAVAKGVDNSPKDPGELRERAILLVMRRTNPEVHLRRLVDKGFFSNNATFDELVKMGKEYIEEYGGCKRDDAYRHMGWKRTEKQWVEKTLTGREIYDLMSNDVPVQVFPKVTAYKGSQLHNTLSSYWGEARLVVKVFEDVEV